MVEGEKGLMALKKYVGVHGCYRVLLLLVNFAGV